MRVAASMVRRVAVRLATAIGSLERCLADQRASDVDEMVSSTRLETRTKESNMYASIWVANP